MKVRYELKLDGTVTLNDGRQAPIRYCDGQLTIVGVGVQAAVELLDAMELGMAQVTAEPQAAANKAAESDSAQVARTVQEDLAELLGPEPAPAEPPKPPRAKKLAPRTKPLTEVMADAVKPANGEAKPAEPEPAVEQPPPAPVVPLRPKVLPEADTVGPPPSKPDLTEPNDPWGLTPEGALAEELKKALGVREVLKFLMGRGVQGIDALVIECDKLKDQVEALRSVKGDLKDRVKRVYAGLQAEQAS